MRKTKQLFVHNSNGTMEGLDVPLGKYTSIRVYLSDKPMDYIEIRPSEHENGIQVRSVGGRLVILPDVSNTVTITRSKD